MKLNIIKIIYILKNQLFALKYTLKHSLIKIISTLTCFGLIRPSSGSCRAWLLSYLEQITFVLLWLCSSMPVIIKYVLKPFKFTFATLFRIIFTSLSLHVSKHRRFALHVKIIRNNVAKVNLKGF